MFLQTVIGLQLTWQSIQDCSLMASIRTNGAQFPIKILKFAVLCAHSPKRMRYIRRIQQQADQHQMVFHHIQQFSFVPLQIFQIQGISERTNTRAAGQCPYFLQLLKQFGRQE